VSGVAARLFSVWCLITGLLCLFLSQNLDNRALFLITFLSFAAALGFFLMEFLVYRTVDVRGVWMQAFIATTSLILMYIHMDKHGLYRYFKLAF
jgi:FtsH-binding integral membrane protein